MRNIVYVLIEQATAERNPFMWDLAVNLYAAQRLQTSSHQENTQPNKSKTHGISPRSEDKSR